MNPWLTRATEKLHFARLALEAAIPLAAERSVAERARLAMLEEASVLHAWGGWQALLNAIAVHLNLPASDAPDAARLLATASASKAHAEALSEIGVLLEQPASWLNQLGHRAHAAWRPRRMTGQPASKPAGMIATSMPAPEDEQANVEELVAACSDFLERHKAGMEEW